MDDSAFSAFLEVDISGDEFEVPTSIVPYIPQAKIEGGTKLVFNLVNGIDGMGRRTFHKKTINTILRQFEDASLSTTRIAHIVTSKGLHYYGCKGMIFNSAYEPLMLSTVKVKYDSASNTMSLSHPRFRLSYSVFEGVSEIVEKTIVKQAIPSYSRGGVDVSFGSDTFGTRVPVEIIIGNLDKMVVKPATPTLSSVSAANFNNIIASHYEAN